MAWAPLIGVTVVNKDTWEKIPESMRPELKRIAEDAMKRLQMEVRRMEDQAVAEMKKHGLKVIKPTEDQYKEWKNAAEASYAKIRGNLVPNQWFDDAMRAAKGGK